jgi:hypothetical protein
VWEIPVTQLVDLYGKRPWRDDIVMDVSFDLDLSTGERQEVGPVLLRIAQDD